VGRVAGEKGTPRGGPWLGVEVLERWLEEWIVAVWTRSRLISWGVLSASHFEQLHMVVICDHFPQFAEEFEDGESLLWGPVSRNGEGDREERTG
jgi:hypothetical protein